VVVQEFHRPRLRRNLRCERDYFPSGQLRIEIAEVVIVQQLTERISDELAALAQKQSDARPTEVYVRMTPQEIKDFDKRKERNFPDLCDSGKQ
jgi:hypothetical protein